MSVKSSRSITDADNDTIDRDIQNALDPERELELIETVNGKWKAITTPTSPRKDKREHYINTDDNGVPVECSCTGFNFHGNCRHITALKLELEITKLPRQINEYETNDVDYTVR